MCLIGIMLWVINKVKYNEASRLYIQGTIRSYLSGRGFLEIVIALEAELELGWFQRAEQLLEFLE